jgi:hypothetical protein
MICFFHIPYDNLLFHLYFSSTREQFIPPKTSEFLTITLRSPFSKVSVAKFSSWSNGSTRFLIAGTYLVFKLSKAKAVSIAPAPVAKWPILLLRAVSTGLKSDFIP